MNEALPGNVRKGGFDLSWFFLYLQMPRPWRIV